MLINIREEMNYNVFREINILISKICWQQFCCAAVFQLNNIDNYDIFSKLCRRPPWHSPRTVNLTYIFNYTIYMLKTNRKKQYYRFDYKRANTVGSVIFSLELTAEGKIFYESDNTVNYPSLHITNFAFTTTWKSLWEILILNI